MAYEAVEEKCQMWKWNDKGKSIVWHIEMMKEAENDDESEAWNDRDQWRNDDEDDDDEMTSSMKKYSTKYWRREMPVNEEANQQWRNDENDK